MNKKYTAGLSIEPKNVRMITYSYYNCRNPYLSNRMLVLRLGQYISLRYEFHEKQIFQWLKYHLLMLMLNGIAGLPYIVS